MNPKKVLVATNNKSKIELLSKWIELSGCIPITPAELNIDLDPEENGTSFLENAEIKAIEWSKHTEFIVLSNDAGMTIQGLEEDWDKVCTKRNVGGNESSDLEKIYNFIEYIKGKNVKNVFWTDAISLAKDGIILKTIQEDTLKGTINTKFNQNKIMPHFWLASLWYFDKFKKTYSELNQNERDAVNEYRNLMFSETIKDVLRTVDLNLLYKKTRATFKFNEKITSLNCNYCELETQIKNAIIDFNKNVFNVKSKY